MKNLNLISLNLREISAKNPLEARLMLQREAEEFFEIYEQTQVGKIRGSALYQV